MQVNLLSDKVEPCREETTENRDQCSDSVELNYPPRPGDGSVDYYYGDNNIMLGENLHPSRADSLFPCKYRYQFGYVGVDVQHVFDRDSRY